jgi:antitoxin component YwqK of YwqJK toxin-antitoxin module
VADQDDDARTSAASSWQSSGPAGDRPRGVPPTASWVDTAEEWRQTETDDTGRPHGPFRSWRADGSLRSIAVHRHGEQVGTAWTFHPDGSLFFVGNFREGSPHGVHRRYASDDRHAERLQSCCVPPGAWQLRQTYAHGRSLDRGWFNRDGARLLETGALYPERPLGVPREAWFNEDCRAWEMGVVWDGTGISGTRRRWSMEGVLRLIENLQGGKRHGAVQAFSETGALEWEAHYDQDRISGPFRARDLPAGHFVDPAIRQQEGAFTDDQVNGPWRYLSADGAVRDGRDLGLTMDARTLPGSGVFENEGRAAEVWRALARTRFRDRHLGEALLAIARAAAEAGDPDEMRRALDSWTMPLGPDTARVQAEDVVARASGRLLPLVDGLKRGADPAILLLAIAKNLQAADRAALDFVTTAHLLAPAWVEPLSTRVLVHGALGDLPAARNDVAALAPQSPEQAQVLELVLRVYFPRFDFWPAREVLDTQPGDAALRPERTVTEVRDTIRRYATRLMRLRAMLRERVAADVPFMIPDLTALLPTGPMPLSRWTFTMSPEEYGGEEGMEESTETGTQTETNTDSGVDVLAPDEIAGPIEITVDESYALAPDVGTVLGTLRQARTDWSGLVWLCWAVGLDTHGLPDSIAPPPAFGRAALMTMERTWRCRDKLNTSGLLALTKGVPGFDWEGTSIDLIPAALADVVLAEYVEARAVFSWLCDPANRSPWQDDLRTAA